MSDQKPPTKREALERLLARGMVQVHLDPRRAGVRVPEEFASQPTLLLNLSRRFPTVPELDAFGVRQVLSFRSVPFPVEIPWPALYAVASLVGAGAHVWSEDVPREVYEQLAARARKPRLRAVPDDGPRDAAGAVETTPARGHLRVVH